ncbi:hypothetical protein ACFQER_05540 [Halomicroarcula sp. GCM10025894]|uniref:hypothetical protein n=1 Tax=Halomicroarcula sp. GCM10025894 TaxID=3252673 RepID=UPI00360690EB
MTSSHVDGGVRADVRGRLPASPLSGDDARWLGWPLLVGLAVVAIYLGTNDYPAYGAGLYVETADAIRANGYALPATVPHYGPEGVPFAYPPLMFYVLAVLRDAGAGAFGTSLYLPPLFTVAALVPTYLLGRDVVGDRRAGTAAALLLVLNPQVLEWHISAGGLVRAPAFVFALWGSYAALRIFRDGAREWVLPGQPRSRWSPTPTRPTPSSPWPPISSSGSVTTARRPDSFGARSSASARWRSPCRGWRLS